ncbi:MAG: hypothetical protein R3190_05605 [Thermoanaerobaculia bacterium]|nr:hypothetical protein [Thermoanaerobaculia bacterium]
MSRTSSLLCALTVLSALRAAPADAAEPFSGRADLLVVEPLRLELEVGEKRRLRYEIRDRLGEPVAGTVVFYSRSRQGVTVDATGEVVALRPGEHSVVALVPVEGGRAVPGAADGPAPLLKREVLVVVAAPPLAELRFAELPEALYAGTSLRLAVRARDSLGQVREDLELGYGSSAVAVATVDRFGELHLRAPGRAVIEARAESVVARLPIVVAANPIASLDLEADTGQARTGDVVHLRAVARDRRGREVPAAPVSFAVGAEPAAGIVAPGATAMVLDDGSFVAERSGVYRVVATVGDVVASCRIEVEGRGVRRDFEVVGHAPVRDRHTSDLWVWEAPNGRDYAITGTWGAGGHAYVWDVTRPDAMVLVDTVRVDARTVNDVKVSPDGRIAALSREGASNRRNGVVLLDVSAPDRGVRVIAGYDDQLNGGVHNLFLDGDHLYAVNNGRRFDVLDISDPTHPQRIGRFALDMPGPAIHDVWVADGVAYTSNWKDGVVAIDVGGAGAGGSPSRPVRVGQYAYLSGWNHAAFPYRSLSTGSFYVFAGDEAFPYSPLQSQQAAAPMRAAGWIHVIEWNDWSSPREVARYQVPEAGSHNFWVEDDVLYVAYYNGGLRAVDVSGELRGDLYRQGREIASWLPLDREGFIPNAAFTWGPQPFKGHVFVTDWNSGLWAVRLLPPAPSKEVGEPI